MAYEYRPVPWKRNLRKIPQNVRVSLDGDGETAFVAGVVRAFSLRDLESGTLSHLGITMLNGGLLYREALRPLSEMGPFSRRNREGWAIIRDDLPKVMKGFSFETPNFGDWSRGSHTVWVDRLVHQRDYIEAPDFELKIEKLAENEKDGIVFKVIVDFPLDTAARDFDDNLLHALNLLQENVGAAGVLPRDAVADELLATLELDWEVFPPGTMAEVVQRALKRMGRPTAQQEELVRERVQLFDHLKPKRFIQGRGGMNSYIGALFADDLVVFENVRYGNALYVLYDNWIEISKRSRIDLLKSDANFTRFVHRAGWQQEFSSHIRAEKFRRGIKDTDRDGDTRAAS